MDEISNPYTPGAGTPPPELAGRDRLLDQARIALERLARNSFAKSMILTGLRGVGKTVLLNKIRQNAEQRGMICIRLEAPEGRSLPSLLAPGLRSALLKLRIPIYPARASDSNSATYSDLFPAICSDLISARG